MVERRAHKAFLSKVTSALRLDALLLECTMTNAFPKCPGLELIRRLHAQAAPKVRVMLSC